MTHGIQSCTRNTGNVDHARFSSDAVYQSAVLEGLIQQGTAEALSTAVALAKRHNQPTWQLYTNHVEHLLKDTSLPSATAAARIDVCCEPAS